MKILSILLKVFAGAMVITALVGNVYLYSQIEGLKGAKDSMLINESDSGEGIDKVVEESGSESGCGNLCRQEIARAVSEAVSSISAVTVVNETVSNQTTKDKVQTSYVSIGSTYTTTNTNWTFVPDSGVYIDIYNDFGDNATVTWEASLKVKDAHGDAFARLYDDTNKRAVDFSEIKSTENATYELVSSGNLPFWRGKNLYKVQVKSLNSTEVTFTGGRVKIKY